MPLTHQIFVTVSAAVCFFPLSSLAQKRVADRPQPKLEKFWSRTFAHQKRELASKRADICFVGDSLTEFWTSTGKAIWELEFHDLHAVNFGIAADRTENILYRLTHADIASNPPRVFVLLAGTNNLSNEPPDSPETTVSAIEAIINYITKQCPESKILVLNLPPNGYDPDSALRKRVIQTNRQLSKLTLPDHVTSLDIYSVFTDSSHRWKRGMTIDGTHFSQRGYDYLSRALAPTIKALKSESKGRTGD
ncbi:MAG: GDSL-type esterase/lipase family protein [Verrucomicrobiales bacterium]